MKLHMNPVTLKELRQLVRSRLVSTGIVGYACLCLVITIITLASNVDRYSYSGSVDRLGRTVFIGLFVVLCGMLLFAIPLFVAFRMNAERSNEHLDLQYTTTLKPRQFVDGKVVAMGVMALVLTSAALPFLTLSYLLRGIDILVTLIATFIVVLSSILCIYEGLFIVTIVESRVIRRLLLFLAVSFQFYIVGAICAVGIGLVEGHIHLDWKDWLLIIGGWASACLMMRAVIIYKLSPPAANRARPLRLVITLLWLAWGVEAFMASWLGHTLEYGWVWTVISMIAYLGFTVVAGCTPPGISRRVRRDISRRWWLRPWQFIFFCGVGGAMLWAFAGASLSLAAVSVNGTLMERYSFSAYSPILGDEKIWVSMVCFSYLFAAAWFVRALWRYFIHKIIPYRFSFILFLFVILMGWALPHLAAVGTERHDPLWTFGNPFAFAELSSADSAADLLGGAFGSLLVAFLINIPFMIRAIRDFKPLPESVETPKEDVEVFGGSEVSRAD